MTKINRLVSVDKELWDLAMKKAKQDGFSLSSIIRLFLKEYVKGNLNPNIEGR